MPCEAPALHSAPPTLGPHLGVAVDTLNVEVAIGIGVQLRRFKRAEGSKRGSSTGESARGESHPDAWLLRGCIVFELTSQVRSGTREGATTAGDLYLGHAEVGYLPVAGARELRDAGGSAVQGATALQGARWDVLAGAQSIPMAQGCRQAAAVGIGAVGVRRVGGRMEGGAHQPGGGR